MCFCVFAWQFRYSSGNEQLSCYRSIRSLFQVSCYFVILKEKKRERGKKKLITHCFSQFCHRTCPVHLSHKKNQLYHELLSSTFGEFPFFDDGRVMVTLIFRFYSRWQAQLVDRVRCHKSKKIRM